LANVAKNARRVSGLAKPFPGGIPAREQRPVRMSAETGSSPKRVGSFTARDQRGAEAPLSPKRLSSAALLLLDYLVRRLVGRFPRAAGPIHVGLSVRVRIRLISICPRLVRIRATCDERQWTKNGKNCQHCLHGDYPLRGRYCPARCGDRQRRSM
jgi:hypothetical protein